MESSYTSMLQNCWKEPAGESIGNYPDMQGENLHKYRRGDPAVESRMVITGLSLIPAQKVIEGGFQSFVIVTTEKISYVLWPLQWMQITSHFLTFLCKCDPPNYCWEVAYYVSPNILPTIQTVQENGGITQ